MVDQAEIKLQRACDKFVQRDVLLCLSGPVEDWIRNNPDDFCDDAINLQTNPDNWTAKQCAEWLDERAIDIDADDFEMNVAWGIVVDDDECREGLQDLVRDNAERAEVYEWWAVTGFLTADLEAHGCVILDWYGIQVWGRETTGQAISMDGVIRQIVTDRGGAWLPI